MLKTLGTLLARRPHWFVLIWTAIVTLGFLTALGGLAGETLFSRLHTGPIVTPGESATGQRLLDTTSSTGPGVHLVLDGIDPGSAAVRVPVEAARTDLARLPGIAAVLDPYLPATPTDPQPGRAFVSADGRAVLVTVLLENGLSEPRSDALERHATERLEEAGRQVPGARSLVGGYSAIFDEITGQVREDLKTGEMISLPVSLFLMVLVFGGFLAAGLPIIGAIASIAGGLACLLGFSYLIELDASLVNIVTVLGLGLCIDYGLLMVSRYREELRALRGVPDSVSDDGAEAAQLGAGQVAVAMRRTLNTAGRTVTFSAVTVAISLSGLLLFEADLLQAVGAAGVSVVLVALLVALTLVPALLALAGPRIIRPGVTHRVPGLRAVVRRLGDVPPERGAFSRLATGVQRHPVLVLLGTLGALVVLALPALELRMASSGYEMLPPEARQRQVFAAVETRFPAASQAPVVVVVRGPVPQVQAWATGLAELPGVAAVDPPRLQGTGADQVVVVGIRPDGGKNSDAARDVVHRIRDAGAPFPTWVTGQTAMVVDFVDSVLARAPYAVAVVVLATFALLFLMTGSLLVPLKALLMNTVSLGASFGVVVWVFQEGNLSGLLGFASVGAIETIIPPMVLAFGFGLAMDYEVFLLSRIKEFKDAGATNDEAVVLGLQRSGRIITSAALIVVAVFGGFAAGQLLVIKETGLALATAVAIDATLVRMLLVPSTMTLLGEWNWWAPRPLKRLHERLGLAESPAN